MKKYHAVIILSGLIYIAAASGAFAEVLKFSANAGCDAGLCATPETGGLVRNSAGSSLEVGSLLQYINAGPDGLISTPDASGNLTGDDTLLTEETVGDDTAWLSFSGQPGMFYHSVVGTYDTVAQPSPLIYVRAWDGVTIILATHYGNSVLFSPALNSPPDPPVEYGIPTFETSISKAAGMGSRIYVIKYNNETANEDWVAVPFEVSGITNTEQLISSIGSRYTPVAGESMIVTLRNNADQVNDSRSMTYMGGVWLPDNEDDPYILIPIGSAASIVISKAGGRSGINTTWEVSGVIPASQTYNIVYNNETANEDRVMDYYGSGITNTEQLINSIGGKYSPVAGESMIVTLRNNADQVNDSRSMTYMGGVWLPDNEDDPYIAIGEYDPCSVVISKAGGRAPLSFIWP